MNETFHDINSLVFNCGGQITIDEDGNINGASNVKQKGKTLYVSGMAGGGGVTTIIGQSVFNFQRGGGVICNVGDSGSTYIFSGNDNPVINGIRIDSSRLSEIAVDDELSGPDNDEPKVFALGERCVINSITVSGSITFQPLPSKFCDEKLSIQVSGSGTVILTQSHHFAALIASVSGSGDICGNSTRVLSATINVSGSGDVNGFHIENSGIVNVSGRGDVHVTATNPSSVLRNKSGRGTIRVYAA